MRIVQLQVCEHVRTASFNQPLLSLSLTKNVNYTANTSHKKKSRYFAGSFKKHIKTPTIQLELSFIITHVPAKTGKTFKTRSGGTKNKFPTTTSLPTIKSNYLLYQAKYLDIVKEPSVGCRYTPLSLLDGNSGLFSHLDTFKLY